MSSVKIDAVKKEIFVLTHKKKTHWKMQIKIFDSVTSSSLIVVINENQYNSRQDMQTLERRLEALHDNDTVEFCNCKFFTYRMDNIYYTDFMCNVDDVKFEMLDV